MERQQHTVLTAKTAAICQSRPARDRSSTVGIPDNRRHLGREMSRLHGRTAVTSISTSQPGLTSPDTVTTERDGKFGCSVVPKN